jgi:hypothetical protein
MCRIKFLPPALAAFPLVVIIWSANEHHEWLLPPATVVVNGEETLLQNDDIEAGEYLNAPWPQTYVPYAPVQHSAPAPWIKPTTPLITWSPKLPKIGAPSQTPR